MIRALARAYSFITLFPLYQTMRRGREKQSEAMNAICARQILAANARAETSKLSSRASDFLFLLLRW